MAQGKTPLLLNTGPREKFGDRSAPKASKPRETSGPRFEAKFEPRFEGRFEGRSDRDQERSAPVRAPREPSMSAPTEERAEKREFKKKEFSSDAPHPAATRARRPESATGLVSHDEGRASSRDFSETKRPARGQPEAGMQTYRVAVGNEHQVKPGNIVGAIANEAGIDSKFIGRIEIFDTYSTVDLPEGMPKEVLQHLKKVWVAGQELRISLERPGVEQRTENSSYPAKSARPERSSIKRFDRTEERPRPTIGMADRGPPRDRGARGTAPARSSKKIFSKGPPRGRK
jgi:ATP-dependent RNA helicase DeaD